ncbi:hypothetical protein DOABOMFO_00031 [Enterococcus phage EF_KTM]|nr:hypothetical protein DDLHHHOO_00065 [Enterococcus phage EF_RCK]WVH07298.1 hypothetical protein AIMFIBHH_00007 [Enterococcus phage EF_TR1]
MLTKLLLNLKTVRSYGLMIAIAYSIVERRSEVSSQPKGLLSVAFETAL